MPVADGIYVVKDSSLTVATVEYANQVTSARLVPNTPIQQVRTLVPDGTISDVDSPIWTFEVTILQKNNTGGLVKALRAAAPGAELVCVLSPKDLDGEDSATFTIIAVPPPFGGEQGAFPTAEMVFPVKGSPVFAAIDEA